MNKIALAIMLILFGGLLLLKNSNLLPEGFGTAYLELANHFWPVVVILFGLYLLIKEKLWPWSRVIFWVILLLIGFWLFFQMTGGNDWIT